eukprot:jgi/Mesvir1/15619/Mv03227-RA.1
MAAALASTVATVPVCNVSGIAKSATRARLTAPKAAVRSINQFSGLKAPVALCQKLSIEEQFAAVARKHRAQNAQGGALCTKNSIAEEVFRVVPVMSLLVLTGIAVGFVLLRVEALTEE